MWTAIPCSPRGTIKSVTLVSRGSGWTNFSISGENLFKIWMNHSNNSCNWSSVDPTIQNIWIDRAIRITTEINRLVAPFSGKLLYDYWNATLQPVEFDKISNREQIDWNVLANKLGLIAGGWGFPTNAAGPALDKMAEDKQTVAAKLDEIKIPIGSKYKMKASGAVAEVSDSIVGKSKITINKCETDWMDNTALQKEIKENIL
jgi:hypothetical protein